MKWLCSFRHVLLCLLSCFSVCAANLDLVVDRDIGRPARYAITKLEASLSHQGIETKSVDHLGDTTSPFIVATLSPQKAIDLIGAAARVPSAAESIIIQRVKNGLLVAGSDSGGLMYALLEVATAIAFAPDRNNPFSEIREVVESPDARERAVSIYTMQKRYFEERLYDEEYWRVYFDMLAEDRFNSFVVVFGYENGGYFAPAYPYFFDTEGFPEVHVTDFSADQQKKYTAAFHRLIDLAHERGLKFTAGLWDHIYRGGVQSGGVKEADPNKALPGVPAGLTKSNLMAYSVAAFSKFLKTFPEIDAVQFRMHSESGLKPGAEMHEFWKRIYQVVKEVRPSLEFNARAKEFPDDLIDLALDMGINIRICTKYWAEQMGLPFHPTHVNRQNQQDRRHGYADLLRYPQRYKMQWRLWNGGTTRVLLWGDPEYARRFAESSHLYDGDGFEVNEMLATKMEAQPHDAAPFELLQPNYRYYRWEFERYWHFYQVFGRVGYNPNTPTPLWDREFVRRFGPNAGRAPRKRAPYRELDSAAHQRFDFSL